jgi:hypothetical protein
VVAFIRPLAGPAADGHTIDVTSPTRQPRQRKLKELAVPPAAPVPWRVTRLRGKRAKVPPIVARTWFEARAIAMVEHHVEPWEVAIEHPTK